MVGEKIIDMEAGADGTFKAVRTTKPRKARKKGVKPQAPRKRAATRSHPAPVVFKDPLGELKQGLRMGIDFMEDVKDIFHIIKDMKHGS